MRAYALGVAVWFALCGLAQAQPSCGEPPRVDDLTLKGDLEGKAQFLSKLVGDADLKGKIETARTDIFSKYPKAGEAHSDAYLEYMFCSFVLSDPKLSGQEKLHAILDFRQAEREPVQSSQTSTTHGDQSPAVIAGGNVAINYQGMSAEEQEAFASKLAAKLLAEMKTGGVLPASPNAKQQVTDAVTNIAQGASQGDPRLQQALSLLAAGNVAQATPLLQAVADEKSARITQDRKDAATAYRNLGAIAGLRNPTKALLAYAKAAEYDPDDVESLYWAGTLEIDHGELSSAETRLKRVLALTPDQDWRHYWAQVGLGDIAIQRGNLPAALQSYRDSLSIAERLAKADPMLAAA
jgi:tetratricopeptide (TPR) repeat protein